MPFFDVPKPAQTFSQEHINNAKQLYDALSRKLILRGKHSLKHWANEFRILYETDDPSHISQVLNWYCDNIRKPYVPLAFSAKAFRKKFPNLEDAMKRSQPVSMVIHHQSQKIIKKLESMGKWPTTDSDLAGCIQTSLDNYQKFNEQLTSSSWQAGIVSSLYSFIRHLQRVMPPPEAFVIEWMSDIHSYLMSGKYKGTNITKLAFRVDHPNFQKRGRQWATEYCGDPSRWENLIRQIQ